MKAAENKWVLNELNLLEVGHQEVVHQERDHQQISLLKLGL
jgi:hypothetical protein